MTHDTDQLTDIVSYRVASTRLKIADKEVCRAKNSHKGTKKTEKKKRQKEVITGLQQQKEVRTLCEEAIIGKNG